MEREFLLVKTTHLTSWFIYNMLPIMLIPFKI
jgi:hypothetical protein